MTVERAAAYDIFSSGALAVATMVLLLFLGSSIQFRFGLAGPGAVAPGYCYWR